MPGDVRTQIGFVAYNSAVHFYSLAEGFNQPHEITVVDIDDPFLPCPDNLLINLNEYKDLIKDLLTQLPSRFAHTHDSNSALGAALQVAFKLMVSRFFYFFLFSLGKQKLAFFLIRFIHSSATNGWTCYSVPDMFAKRWTGSIAIA